MKGNKGGYEDGNCKKEFYFRKKWSGNKFFASVENILSELNNQNKKLRKYSHFTLLEKMVRKHLEWLKDISALVARSS